MNAIANDIPVLFGIDGKPVDLENYAELLIGCGNRASKQIRFEFVPKDFQNVTRLDIDPLCNPDVLHDLNVLPLPFADDSFNEIHAMDILEHTGQQGDWRFFFAQFSEFWRILKPGGYLIGASPSWDSPWAWGDPGHSRILSQQSLIFLDQDQYTQIGSTPMTDYRHVYKASLRTCIVKESDNKLMFVLMAIK